MIELQLKAQFDILEPPFVTKLRTIEFHDKAPVSLQETIAVQDPKNDCAYDCHSASNRFVLHTKTNDEVDGDVLLCMPSRGVAQRLFRRNSRHNTLLFTERCDQLCVMCSQPPKNTHDEWRFPYYEKALHLADSETIVGISGGEPTLYKDALLGMIDRVSAKRSDLSFHILSNGQHFSADDEPLLSKLHETANIVWGIPLYSHIEATHDEIVGKKGAFRAVMANLLRLGATGARIELRTVITAMNIFDLPHLARFVGDHIPFVGEWAIMAMEPIGYARANWQRLFFDHSSFPQPIINALEMSSLTGVRCHLYNIPLCTMPKSYRSYCVDSISDWKKKYLPECVNCAARSSCPGFFEWYSSDSEWAGIKAIRSNTTEVSQP